jgi:cytochrome b6-f complex iron-sulfur subunit
MDRRAFLKNVEWLPASVACAAGLSALWSGCAGYRYVAYTRSGPTLVIRKADFGEGPYALLADAQRSRAIYLHRHGEEDFSAVLTRCAHRGCQVEPAGSRLVCPCHGSEYELTGEVLQGPAERALLRYRVTTDTEFIYIELPDPP